MSSEMLIVTEPFEKLKVSIERSRHLQEVINMANIKEVSDKNLQKTG